RHEFNPNALEGAQRIGLIETDTRRQQRRDVFRQAAREFFQHALLGYGSRNGLALEGEVVVEAGYELVHVQSQPLQPVRKVEQVAALASLQKRAQLGAEQFLRLE